jgi:hypothetical protein
MRMGNRVGIYFVESQRRSLCFVKIYMKMNRFFLSAVVQNTFLLFQPPRKDRTIPHGYVYIRAGKKKLLRFSIIASNNHKFNIIDMFTMLIPPFNPYMHRDTRMGSPACSVGDLGLPCTRVCRRAVDFFLLPIRFLREQITKLAFPLSVAIGWFNTITTTITQGKRRQAANRVQCQLN